MRCLNVSLRLGVKVKAKESSSDTLTVFTLQCRYQQSLQAVQPDLPVTHILFNHSNRMEALLPSAKF